MLVVNASVNRIQNPGSTTTLSQADFLVENHGTADHLHDNLSLENVKIRFKT